MLDRYPLELAAEHIAAISLSPVAETFSARGADAINIHEATRIPVLRSLFSEEKSFLSSIAARLANHLEQSPLAAFQIERLFLRLLAGGATTTIELEDRERAWSAGRSNSQREAFNSMLSELIENELVTGEAAIRARITSLQLDFEKLEAPTLLSDAHALLQASEAHDDPYLEADSRILLGMASRAMGNLTDAATHLRRSVELNSDASLPRNQDPGRVRELGIALGHLSTIYDDLELDAEAAATADSCLLTAKRLLDLEASPLHRRDLGVAHWRLGVQAFNQERHEDALAHFTEDLAQSKSLSKEFPTDGSAATDEAIAHNRVGATYEQLGRLEEAATHFASGLAICRRLWEVDPLDQALRRELAFAYGRSGRIALKLDQLATAESELRSSLGLHRGLTDEDPENMQKLGVLGIAHYWAGRAAHSRGNSAQARSDFQRVRDIDNLLRGTPKGVGQPRGEYKKMMTWLNENET